MRRRSRAGGEPAKTRRRKTVTPKQRNAPKAVRRRNSSATHPETPVARLTRELQESLAREEATSEVLRIISSSRGELQPVFRGMLQNAMRICEANFGNLLLVEEDGLRSAVSHNYPSPYAKLYESGPLRPGPHTGLGRVMRTKQIVHIVDLAAGRAYEEGDPLRVMAVEVLKARSFLGVPMLKDGELIGVIVIYRQEVRPFTDKQIALVKNFAAQAVVAIENTRLLNELKQSLEQQTATADVLKVISSSPGELQPVFDAMLSNATRICEASLGTMALYENGGFRHVALHGVPVGYAELREREPVIVPRPEQGLGRLANTKQIVHIKDILAEPVEARGRLADLAGARTLLIVPMLKEQELVGSMGIYRQEVRPFTDKQIELVRNFAAQAVIAIENTRLLNELRQRTADLTESLEQQTATSEVLGVISSSPGELEAVFRSMLENAVRICQAKFGFMLRYDGDAYHTVAELCDVPAYVEEMRRGPLQPHPESALGRVARTKEFAQISDVTAHRLYAERDPIFVAGAELGGMRTIAAVPMVKDQQLIGAITIFRKEVRPFTDKQIELVKNFAAQAVIAIENARLLNELHQRTADLTESLEQQTATSEILASISGSMTDTKPVFEAIVRNLLRLFPTSFAVVQLLRDGMIHMAALDGEPGFEKLAGHYPLPLDDRTITGRAMLSKQVVQFAPLLDNPAAPAASAQFAREFGSYNSMISAPMIREDKVIGAIATARREPREFDSKQVALIKSFADQAVIAIENVRLFNDVQKRTEELSDALEQQTATADVLKIISRSAFDLRAVLQTLVESAARFCAADNATIIREKDGLFYTAEAYGYSREFLNYIRNIPIKAERGSASGRALVEGRVVHIPDVKADPEYTFVEAPRLGDFRTALCVPMLRERTPIGVLTLTRSAVQPFTDKQIELVTTFADQAAIAIENVRLFDEIQDKSRQLEEASQHKSQFLANMSHELRTPLNAILGYTELMADGAYGEPSDKMLGILKRLEANGKHLLGLINDVLDLSKIEAGQLVLELSDYSVQDIAQTVRSTLEPLAADKKLGFKVEVAPQLPSGRGDGRRLTQVLINLVGNAIKFTDTGEVAIKAEANNGSFHVSVRDTGPGISAADQAKLFQEFQQADNAITRKKGGTGLGLAISKRIIEMHGGRIWVESQPGQGSTFAFTLPVIVERQVEAA